MCWFLNIWWNMEDIYVDTIKLKETGENIVKLGNELNEELNFIFSRLTNLSKMDAWVGIAVEDYIARANIEKQQYMQFKDAVIQMGKFLIEKSDIIESEINNSKR